MKSLTLNLFIEKCIKVHDNKYDYSRVQYKNNKTKVEIICPRHGSFMQKPTAHLGGQGCPICRNEKNSINYALTNDEFVAKAVKVHGTKYDYSLVNYKNNRIKIIIICPKHGEFIQQPSNHLNGNGCLKCFFENITSNLNDFIIKAKQVHGNKYNYNSSVYVNSKVPLAINCPKHGSFLQSPSQHLEHGCPKCGGTSRLNTNDFIIKSNLVHGGKYDYSKAIYINNATKLIIVCHQHGIFTQTPNRHLQGDGCPKCNSSKGEAKIRKYLVDRNFVFNEQTGFDTCKNKRKLPFDFVVNHEDKTFVIEYYGEQHYKLVKFSRNPIRANNKFEQTKRNDEIKTKWCQSNSVPLCVIPYWDFQRIEEILDKFLEYK